MLFDKFYQNLENDDTLKDKTGIEIVSLLELCMNATYFTIKEVHYRQCFGTAMHVFTIFSDIGHGGNTRATHFPLSQQTMPPTVSGDCSYYIRKVDELKQLFSGNLPILTSIWILILTILSHLKHQWLVPSHWSPWHCQCWKLEELWKTCSVL